MAAEPGQRLAQWVWQFQRYGLFGLPHGRFTGRHNRPAPFHDIERRLFEAQSRHGAKAEIAVDPLDDDRLQMLQFERMGA
jgi:hypothetical protein